MNRARIERLERAAEAIVKRRSGPPALPSDLTAEERQFFEARQGTPFGEWSPEDLVQAAAILAQYTPPEVYGSHGNGSLPGCQCDRCEDYRIYTQYKMAILAGIANNNRRLVAEEEGRP